MDISEIVFLYKWRQFTSIVETSVLQNINIMDLQLLCIPISPLLFDDMQVWACLVLSVWWHYPLLLWVFSHFLLQMSSCTDCSLRLWEYSNFQHYSLTDRNSLQSLIVWNTLCTLFICYVMEYCIMHSRYALLIYKRNDICADSCKLFSDLNYRHRNAQMAGRASVELHTLIYFKNGMWSLACSSPLFMTKIFSRSLFSCLTQRNFTSFWCVGLRTQRPE